MNRTLATVAAAVLIAGCSGTMDKKEAAAQRDEAKAVNCSTAEADIRALQSEKAHTSDQIEAGVTSIVPVGLVANTLRGKEGSNLKIAAGDYNDALDKKIAEIKQTCGL